MPFATIDNTLEMYYELDDFTDPWREPETVVLQHGGAKNSRTWYAWPPLLARKYRVVRPDARGHGRSSVPLPNYPWSLSGLARDLRVLLDHLGVEKVHLVGCTVGGLISLQFAYEYPERLYSLTTIGTPYSLDSQRAERIEKFKLWHQLVLDGGVAAWLRHNREDWTEEIWGRDKNLTEWFSSELSKTSSRVMAEIFEFLLPTVDLTDILPGIRVPTLILEGSLSATVSREIVSIPAEERRKLQQLLPNAKYVAFPGEGHRISLTIPEKCVEEFLRFLGEIKG